MSGKRFCLDCGKKIDYNSPCPYCGFDQYEGDNVNIKNICFKGKERRKKNKAKGFSDEEILALGLYPKDEAYKMSLISQILGKK